MAAVMNEHGLWWDGPRLRSGRRSRCIGGYEKYRNGYVLYSRLPGLNIIDVRYTEKKARSVLEAYVREWLEECGLEEKKRCPA